jgi:hypothetical protein
VEIISRAASGSLDVCIPPENKGHSSRCLIDACMPYERRHQFPPIAESSEELKKPSPGEMARDHLWITLLRPTAPEKFACRSAEK